MKRNKTDSGQAEKPAHIEKKEGESMKRYTHIMITGSPEFVKRFNRWLKNRYNVNYPDWEKRYGKLGIVSVRWTIKYHNNWFLGNSEECLLEIAEAAAEKHARHTKNAHTGSWDVYSE